MGKYNFESKQKLLSSVNHASNVKKKNLMILGLLYKDLHTS